MMDQVSVHSSWVSDSQHKSIPSIWRSFWFDVGQEYSKFELLTIKLGVNRLDSIELKLNDSTRVIVPWWKWVDETWFQFKCWWWCNGLCNGRCWNLCYKLDLLQCKLQSLDLSMLGHNFHPWFVLMALLSGSLGVLLLRICWVKHLLLHVRLLLS